jgi:hypothetical protein
VTVDLACDTTPPALVQALLTQSPPTSPQLASALDALLADRSALVAWLAQLDDDGPATQVAARSYWHHNGFAKLVLHSAPDFRIRLHVWPAGPNRRGETNPHGHRWEFASTVICGDGLRNTEYRETDAGVPSVRYAYVGSKAGGTLTAVGNACLAVHDRRVIRTGERYTISTETVHTVDPIGMSVVATLLVQGPPRLESTAVYCAPGEDGEQPGRPIHPGEVRQLVRAVVGALDEPGAGWR